MPARILWVGHSTVLVELDGTRLLTDPLLRRRVVHLRRLDSAPGAVPDLDAVLVSHLHFDHLDIPSLALLGRNLRLVVPRGAGALARRKRFTHVDELGVGEELRIGSLVVRGAPAVHDPRRLPGGRARAEPLGFVVEGSRSVYFAGDTDVFEGMAALAPVDVALLPIWGWGPTIGPGHMSPREAVQAAQLLRASVVVPIHWGTYFPLQLARHGRPALLDRPAEEFRAQMEEQAPEIEVRTLHPGQETTF